MLELTEIQTKPGRRMLPLGTLALDVLPAHRDRQVFDRKENKGWQDQGLIFCSVYGAPLDDARAHDFWTSAVKKAGLPRHTPYALRHSVASNLVHDHRDHDV